MKDNQLKKAQEFVRNKSPIQSAWFISLHQVLTALEKVFKNEYHKMIFQDSKLFFICAENPVCQFYWDLSQDFSGQSEKDQLAIAHLLGYKTGGEDEK